MKELTIQELLDILLLLPEKKRKAFAGCRYDCDCAWTSIYGIDEELFIDDDGKSYLRFQGD